MNLGEALSLRARQAQKLNDLKGRIKENSVVQEGSEPAEDAEDLIATYLVTSTEHRVLVAQIIRTNATTVADGVTLLDMLQEREELVRERNLYDMAANAATASGDRYRFMRSEIRYVSQVNVADLRRKEEAVGEQVRVLDARIQKINWETELLV